jgi:hypothetical protein
MCFRTLLIEIKFPIAKHVLYDQIVIASFQQASFLSHGHVFSCQVTFWVFCEQFGIFKNCQHKEKMKTKAVILLAG